MAAKNEFRGSVTLALEPVDADGAEAPRQVQVALDVDENQMLRIFVHLVDDLEHCEMTTVDPEKPWFSEEVMERVCRDAEVNAAADQLWKENVEAQWGRNVLVSSDDDYEKDK